MSLLLFWQIVTANPSRRLTPAKAIIERWNAQGSLPPIWKNEAPYDATYPLAILKSTGIDQDPIAGNKKRKIITTSFDVLIYALSETDCDQFAATAEAWLDQVTPPGDNMISCLATRLDVDEFPLNESLDSNVYECKIMIKTTSTPV